MPVNPSYSTFVLDLSTAGYRELASFTGLLRCLEYTDGTGALNLDAKVTIRAGGTSAHPIPMRINGAVKAEFIDGLRIEWEAQSGITARFFVTRNPETFDIDAEPPAVLTLTDFSGALATAKVSVGATATLIRAANTGRRTVTVYNAGAATVYVGAAAVTTDGYPLGAGQALTLSGSTSAVYGIVAAGTCEVRVLEEG